MFCKSNSNFQNQLKVSQMMQVIILLMMFLSIFGIIVHQNENNNKLLNINEDYNTTLGHHRDKKFIFTILRFPNSLCTTEIGTGICFTSRQCRNYGGENVGECARGFGVCCAISVGSGTDITINNTLITSIGYPNYFNEARISTFEIYFDHDICQIRYDFEAMELVAPNRFGFCLKDQMVFPEDTKSTYFCGNAPTDYHWYVETEDDSSPHTINITTDDSNFNRRFAIRVSYIPCMQGVPTKCGNWYPGVNGVVESYNYGNGFYLAGLQYSICFRKEIGYCNTTLLPVGDDHFIGNADTLRLPVGKLIPVVGISFLPWTFSLCDEENIQQKAMYSTQFACNYPPEITSENTAAAFHIYIETLINTGGKFVNRNRQKHLKHRSGFKFNWRHNKC